MSTAEFQSKVVGMMGNLTVQAMNLTNYNVEDANDLVQETLLKALSKKDQYRHDNNFKSWISVIMRHTFINEYRKKHHYKTKIRAADMEVLDQRTDHQRSSVESNMILRDVMDALNRLPEKNKMPIIRYYEGYAYDEIASEFGIPVSRVKSRIFAGRQILRDVLSDYRNRAF